MCSLDGSAVSVGSAEASPPAAFLKSAALPNEKARRSLDVLLRPLMLMAASCFAAGLSMLPLAGPVGEASGDDPSAWAGAAGDCSAAASLAMVAGWERGDGLATRLPASERPDEGVLAGLGESCLAAPSSWLFSDEGRAAGVPVGIDALRLADWYGARSG